jgi:integrase
VELLDDVPASSLAPDLIEDVFWMDLIANVGLGGKDMSGSAANAYLRELQKLLDRVFPDKRDNPARQVDPKKRDPHRTRFLTEEEMRTVLAAAQDCRTSHLIYPLLLTLLATGGRYTGADAREPGTATHSVGIGRSAVTGAS